MFSIMGAFQYEACILLHTLLVYVSDVGGSSVHDKVPASLGIHWQIITLLTGVIGMCLLFVKCHMMCNSNDYRVK